VEVMISFLRHEEITRALTSVPTSKMGPQLNTYYYC
jgi:hypothetical protein